MPNENLATSSEYHTITYGKRAARAADNRAMPGHKRKNKKCNVTFEINKLINTQLAASPTMRGVSCSPGGVTVSKCRLSQLKLKRLRCGRYENNNKV